MSYRPLVMFDFDGVIADSYTEVFAFFQQFFPQLSEEAFHDVFDDNVYTAFHDPHSPIYLGDDPKDIERYQQYAREKSATMAQILKPFPQIIAHLKTFAKLADIVIITSSLNAPVETFLANHELMPPIKSVMGRDTHASKVLKIKQALADYGKTPTEARFVTDSRGDLLEAATCEVPSIAVSWGFQSADHLAKTVPTPEIAQDIPHLFELLSTFANT